jgi:hypothetical protein
MRTDLALGACALAAAGMITLLTGLSPLGDCPNEPNPTGRAVLSGPPGPSARLRESSPRRHQRESVIAAANAALKLEEQDGNDTLTAALATWAGSDMDEALAWATQLPEGEGKHRATLILAREAARTDPEIALTLARDLPPSSARDELIAHAVAQWAASAPEDTAAWVEQQEVQPSRDTLLATLSTVWADSDPSAAARYALDHLPPGRLQDDALVGIVQRWTQQDPVAVAAWVERFPEEPLKAAAMENVVKLWARQDPHAIGPWLKTLAEGPSRDTALRAYSEQLALIGNTIPSD